MKNKRNFIILSLPRSRTAWLSLYLTLAGLPCEHELIGKSESFEAAIKKIKSEGIGSCDTSQVFRLKELKDELDPRILVIKRNANEVIDSLSKIGITGIDDFIIKQNELLSEASKGEETLTINYEEIDSRIEEIYSFLSGGLKFDKEVYKKVKDYNIKFNNLIECVSSLNHNVLNNYGL
jgi:S-adenosylmethionine:tRNA-ribosyltransferase-isomerase (queuine synthetase)